MDTGHSKYKNQFRVMLFNGDLQFQWIQMLRNAYHFETMSIFIQSVAKTCKKICTSFLIRPCIEAFIGWDNVFVLFHDANLAHTTFIRENMNSEWESTLLLHPLIILLFLVCPSPVMSTIINCFYLVDLQRMLFYCHIVLKMKNI